MKKNKLLYFLLASVCTLTSCNSNSNTEKPLGAKPIISADGKTITYGLYPQLYVNDSTLISAITEKAMTYFTSTQISINVCYSVSSTGVDPYEIKAIMENILNSNARLNDLRTVINTLLTDFHTKYPDEKDMTGPKFIANSIAMKPNTKDKNIIEMKNIILNWLNTSERYQNIKTQATKNNYYKSILGYIAITVNVANKQS